MDRPYHLRRWGRSALEDRDHLWPPWALWGLERPVHLVNLGDQCYLWGRWDQRHLQDLLVPHHLLDLWVPVDPQDLAHLQLLEDQACLWGLWRQQHLGCLQDHRCRLGLCHPWGLWDLGARLGRELLELRAVQYHRWGLWDQSVPEGLVGQ